MVYTKGYYCDHELSSSRAAKPLRLVDNIISSGNGNLKRLGHLEQPVFPLPIVLVSLCYLLELCIGWVMCTQNELVSRCVCVGRVDQFNGMHALGEKVRQIHHAIRCKLS